LRLIALLSLVVLYSELLFVIYTQYVFLGQGFIETRLRSTLIWHSFIVCQWPPWLLTSRPWYCCHDYVSFHSGHHDRCRMRRRKFTLPEHLISTLVFIEVHVFLSFVSPYFVW